MRLWTVHPKYLDGKGLVALWREALLAQAVLKGKTRGFQQHPQLIRFRETAAPVAAIGCYLRAVYREGLQRGYAFNAEKMTSTGDAEPIMETQGQLDYEWLLVKERLRLRAPSWLAGIASVALPDPHPLFRIVPGPVAPWERVKRA